MSMRALPSANTDPTRLACLLANATANWELHAGVLHIIIHQMLPWVGLGVPPSNVVPGVVIIFVVKETSLPVPGVVVLPCDPAGAHSEALWSFAYPLLPLAR